MTGTMLKRAFSTLASRVGGSRSQTSHSIGFIYRAFTTKRKLLQPRHLSLPTTIGLSKGRGRSVSDMASLPQDTVSFDLTDLNGQTTKVHIKPSYPKKPKAVANLVAALPDLLTDAAMPAGPIKRFGTSGWDLDESGDTIHRYIEFDSNEDVSVVLQAIGTASEELNHDPHLHIDGQRLTISCTTHIPAGLSMKDVKLAKSINEILTAAQHDSSELDDEAEILTQRQRAREQNMEAVRQAKQSCSCT